MAFHVGQKVVCVKAFPGGVNLPSLVEGGIHVVDGIEVGNYVFGVLVDPDIVGLLLVGVNHPAHPFLPGRHFSYGSDLFRPLQEQGMSILRAIAANPKRELEAV